MQFIENLIKIVEEVRPKTRLGWRFRDKAKNILFLESRKTDSGYYVNIFKNKREISVVEYLVTKDKNRENLIQELNILTLDNDIDVIVCNPENKEIAEEMNKIAMGRRGLLRKEICIVCKEEV